MAQSKIKASKQIFFDDNVDVNSKKLTNLATPTADSDAVTKLYADSLLGTADAMIFKGVSDIATVAALTTYGAGWTYKASDAGTFKGQTVQIGDLLIAVVDRAGSGNLDADWTVAQTNIDGAVTGPASATDLAVALFDGTGGKTIKNSLVTIDANGSPNIPSGQAYKINGVALTQDNIGDGTTYKQYSATEKTKLSGIETAADVTDAVNVGSSIHGATAKASIVDADKFAMIDSEASNVLKTSLWSVIKSTLKTYFDTLYAAAGTYLLASGYVCRETPAGLLNGSNTVYTLANTPTSGTEMVFLNGMLQNAGAGNDYTISTNTITMAVAPISTDVILVTYWK